MQSRTYAILMAVVGFALFVVVVATNLIIDPQHVFGTGLLPRSPNANDRYERLHAYKAAPQRYDGLIFGSSRAVSFSPDELARWVNGVSFANFAVAGGTVVDYVAILEFVLRDKASRGERLRTVFVLLDVDDWGQQPFTNKTLEYLMPPEISGQNPLRFWWKNLIAIQFKAWSSTVRAARKADAGMQRGESGTGILQSALSVLAPSSANAQALVTAPPPAKRERREFITHGIDYRHKLNLLERFVALCREHDVQIVAVISPLSAQNADIYDPVDLGIAIADVSRIVPLWDFTNSKAVSNNPEFWFDFSHFRPEVVQMMLRRMFGGEVPPAWASFGRRLP
ncbi:MAG TPA: hypothetical protein VGF53_07020 [Pseudolabrys sp.]|jgi:hypothetical protein